VLNANRSQEFTALMMPEIQSLSFVSQSEIDITFPIFSQLHMPAFARSSSLSDCVCRRLWVEL
jgi:hypothetical protein